jgi:DNA-binding response OmpR family regulator
MRVLVVEDEDALAQVVARSLRREGMAVDLACDGASGLEKALVTPCDLIALDRNLPHVHGDEVCRRLAAAGSETRILMLTAAGLLQDKVTGLNLGADGYLVKPFAFEELVARLCALARRAGQPRPAG